MIFQLKGNSLTCTGALVFTGATMHAAALAGLISLWFFSWKGTVLPVQVPLCLQERPCMQLLLLDSYLYDFSVEREQSYLYRCPCVYRSDHACSCSCWTHISMIFQLKGNSLTCTGALVFTGATMHAAALAGLISLWFFSWKGTVLPVQVPLCLQERPCMQLLLLDSYLYDFSVEREQSYLYRCPCVYRSDHACSCSCWIRISVSTLSLFKHTHTHTRAHACMHVHTHT